MGRRAFGWSLLITIAIAISFAMVAAAVGCTSLDGLTDNQASDSGSDAAATPDTSANEDAAASGNDSAFPSSDAGADAAFCQDATFCDQFERGILRGDWDNDLKSDGGAIELTTAHALSPTRSVLFSIGKATDSKTYASFQKTFPTNSNNVHRVVLRLAMNAEAQPARVMTLATISLRYPGNIVRNLALGSNDLGLRLVEQELVNGGSQIFNAYLGTEPIIANAWNLITLDLDMTTTPVKATLSLGTQIIRTVTPSVAFTPTNLDTMLAAGFVYAEAGDATHMWLDDIRLDITP